MSSSDGIKHRETCLRSSTKAQLAGVPQVDTFGTSLLSTEELLQELQTHQIKLEMQARDFTNAALNSLPGLFYLIDEEGHFLRWNHNLEQVSGYCADEIATMSPLDFFGEAEKGPIAEAIKEVFAQGEAHIEATFQAKDKTRTPYLFTGKRALLDQKLCLMGLGIDITERRKIENDLRETTNRLRETQRIAHLGSWTRDLVKGETSMTDELLQIFEIDPNALPADAYKTFINTIHPEDRDTVAQAYLNSIRNGLPYEITHRLRMGDGRVKWINQKCSSEFDATGKPLSSSGVVQDVTERTQAEIELRIASVAFESHEPTLITDTHAVILRANQAFTDLTGFSTAELIGQSSRLLYSDRHDATFFAEIWKTVFAMGAWQGEIWGRKMSGEEYINWLNISVVRNRDGDITHYVRTHQDITQRKKEEERIANLAFFDALTQLANRTLLMDRLKQAMNASKRHGTCGALLFLDLDHFKTLNDTLGHDKGDLLLQQVAQRLSASVRTGDTVARLGGDEFVVVLGGLDENIEVAAPQVKAIGEIMLAALNSSYQLRDIEYQNSASIGATLFHGDEFAIDDLLKQADLAMYKSKKSGRNSLSFFDPTMQTVVVERSTLKDKLGSAIRDNQFVLHYQAQVDIKGRVTGAEALVRWQHPERGMVFPEEFIPLAEETRLILPLSQWVLETACTQLAQWAAEDETANLSLAVNVSAKQFYEPGFVDKVLSAVSEADIGTNRLKLELTENLLGIDVEKAIAKMWALKDGGVGFSLDDFGTGHSSISNLKRMPLDNLKIDQSFVCNIAENHDYDMITKTIVALAKNLNLSLIAEGVETETQLDFLTGIGCDFYQGYYFSRPLPVDEFEPFAQRVRFNLPSSYNA